MFTKQKQNRKFTNVLYLQNKNKIRSLQTSYVYKIKFTNTLCLQNKIQNKVYKTTLKFTNTLCLQNQNSGQIMFAKQTNVYKTKNYRQVMFTKQN